MCVNHWQLKFNPNKPNGGLYFRLHLLFIVSPDRYPTESGQNDEQIVVVLKKCFYTGQMEKYD